MADKNVKKSVSMFKNLKENMKRVRRELGDINEISSKVKYDFWSENFTDGIGHCKKGTESL